MNNRIMATMFALAIALFIGVVPVKAEAACAHNLSKVEAESATCTADGHSTYYTCSKCPRIFTDAEGKNETTLEGVKIAKNGHDYELKVEADGYTHSMVCSVCDHEKSGTHTLNKQNNGDGTHDIACQLEDCTYEVKNAAHDDGSAKDCKCGICGAEMTHDLSKEWDKGSENHWKTCSVCYGQFEKTKHTAVWVTTEETHKGECSVCGYVFYGETAHEFEYTDNKDGTHTKVCTKCEYTVTDEEHTDTNENCSCDTCDAALTHSFSTWTKGESGHWQICTKKNCKAEQGFAAHDYEYAPGENDTHSMKCTVCEKEVASEQCVDTETVDHKCDKCLDLLIHAYNQSYMVGETGKAPKCEEDGIYLHKTCNVCGLYMKLDGTIVDEAGLVNPRTGHVEKEVVHFAEYHVERCKKCLAETSAQEAHDFTLVDNNDGTHTATCSGCSRVITEGHEDVDTDDDCVCDAGCGHVMNHYRADMTYHAHKEPTCTEDGNVAYFTCNTCGEVMRESTTSAGVYVPYTKETKLEALDHDWEARKDTNNGQHLQKCKRCGDYQTLNCQDTDGDCLCDVNSCDSLVHSHKLIFVAEVKPTCGKTGTEAYYYYQDCGKKFDLNQNPIEDPAVIPAADHVWGDEWVVTEDTHAHKCTACGEAGEAEAHVYRTRNVSCDVCGAVSGLDYVAAKAATCTEPGNVEHWYSTITGKAYADEEGTVELTTTVIPATDHRMSGVMDLGNGKHGEKCMNAGCDRTLNVSNHAAGDVACFCDTCGAAMDGHGLELVKMEAPTCTKSGQQAYFKCSCNAMYDMSGKALKAPVKIAAKGHTGSGSLIRDTQTKDHYQICAICGEEVHEDHDMILENPLKGNYHQWTCVCGEVKTEIHYNNDGDNACDECKHDMANTSVNVEQHDSKTVITGDADLVQPTKSWWQNWLETLTPGNADGATTSKPSASESTTAPSGNTGSTSVPSGNASAPSGNTSAPSGSTTVPGGSASAPSDSTSAPSTGIINQFFQWLGQLFNSWLGM